MIFKVRLTRDAEADLDRLFDFFVERELARDGGDLDLPEQAMTALRAGIATLKSSPYATNSKTTTTELTVMTPRCLPLSKPPAQAGRRASMRCFERP